MYYLINSYKKKFKLKKKRNCQVFINKKKKKKKKKKRFLKFRLIKLNKLNSTTTTFNSN